MELTASGENGTSDTRVTPCLMSRTTSLRINDVNDAVVSGNSTLCHPCNVYASATPKNCKWKKFAKKKRFLHYFFLATLKRKGGLRPRAYVTLNAAFADQIALEHKPRLDRMLRGRLQQFHKNRIERIPRDTRPHLPYIHAGISVAPLELLATKNIEKSPKKIEKCRNSRRKKRMSK
jgi:hypothetical protein